MPPKVRSVCGGLALDGAENIPSSVICMKVPVESYSESKAEKMSLSIIV
jgi:hypothetical protein